MQLGIGPHLDDVDLEQYAMGQLPEDRMAPFEEHFLACVACQDRFLETDVYVNAVRSVSPRLRKERPLLWRDRLLASGPRWVAAVAVGAMLLFQVRTWVTAPGPPATVVFLRASRGIEGLSAANAPADKPIVLRTAISELPALPAYRLEVVSASGKPTWQAETAAREGAIALTVPKGLPAGQYFLRLYGGGELLREFGLRVE
jgi:hypothetical protein